MPRVSGKEVFNVLIILVALVFLLAKFVEYTDLGKDFDIAGLTKITQDKFLWELGVVFILAYLIFFVINKAEAGFNPRSFLTVVIVTALAYIVIYFISSLFNLNLPLPIKLTSSVISP